MAYLEIVEIRLREENSREQRLFDVNVDFDSGKSSPF